jgi:nucleotide-binding universal stress UspA family protein
LASAAGITSSFLIAGDKYTLPTSTLATPPDGQRKRAVQKVHTVLRDGDPATAILSVAKEEKADTIVMGRRGLGDLAGLLLGSASHKATHLAECACLTVK